jgi:hypothetical protein
MPFPVKHAVECVSSSVQDANAPKPKPRTVCLRTGWMSGDPKTGGRAALQGRGRGSQNEGALAPVAIHACGIYEIPSKTKIAACGRQEICL